MTIRAVLFDFDGTLADSFAAITASVNHVRQSYGLSDLTESVVREYVGLGLEQLMNDLLPNVSVVDAEARYRDHHTGIMISHTKLFPGVLETLATLQSRGLKLAICSNKRVEFTKTIAAGLGIADYFQEILGPDDVGVPKPDPAMLLECCRRLGVSTFESVYIGDMAVDVHTAKAAVIPVWLVPGGATGRENLLDAGPDRMLHSIADVTDLV